VVVRSRYKSGILRTREADSHAIYRDISLIANGPGLRPQHIYAPLLVEATETTIRVRYDGSLSVTPVRTLLYSYSLILGSFVISEISRYSAERNFIVSTS
jgi:hypothetical protein